MSCVSNTDFAEPRCYFYPYHDMVTAAGSQPPPVHTFKGRQRVDGIRSPLVEPCNAKHLGVDRACKHSVLSVGTELKGDG